MNFYDAFMLPLEIRGLAGLRERYVTMAEGHVLEIGAGTGVNLAYYGPAVDQLTITDMELSSTLRKLLMNSNIKHNLMHSKVEALDFEDESFDTVVFTLVFCSVQEVDKGLSEIYRVLKKGGRLIFIEHVLPVEEPSRRIFNAITPVWKHLASGCHLNRDFIAALNNTPFQIQSQSYEFGTKLVAGIAKK